MRYLAPHFQHQGIALIDNELQLKFSELTNHFAHCLLPLQGKPRQLIAIEMDNSLAATLMYLACLDAGHVALLLDAKQAREQKAATIAHFQANYCYSSAAGLELQSELTHSLANELALMLATSGSTGTVKYVCLSLQNIISNAQSIIEYLDITPTERAITSLPLHYSYGLSVLHSHLFAGAQTVLTSESVMSKGFWALMKEQQISHLAAVPAQYQMLARLKLEQMDLPHLTTLTQAGGRLSDSLASHFATWAKRSQRRFFIMYGQTEATARIAYLNPAKAGTKPGCIGQAIPGGTLSLRGDNGELITVAKQQGELVYQGGNVMLGYAGSLSDLSHFPPLEQLHTGDLAYLDDDGDFVISGRIKRIIKLQGVRFSLDELEQRLQQDCYSTLVTLGEDENLLVVSVGDVSQQEIKQFLRLTFAIHPSLVRIKQVSELPLLSNGKIDYQTLLLNSKVDT
ncbi:AMP-binding protein [Motilimonas cestriensis]|uniref:AMP-binding protein n=1 Tax=Motilimonas cestriensis TaxID=2742685 RepID=A0ABS8WAP8_9GAMM|nr:AMP-binding protein [Motilimonas cestriensis]MCE2595588.1 AMP-binding protein [Motilimonas cestriensis]